MSASHWGTDCCQKSLSFKLFIGASPLNHSGFHLNLQPHLPMRLKVWTLSSYSEYSLEFFSELSFSVLFQACCEVHRKLVRMVPFMAATLQKSCSNSDQTNSMGEGMNKRGHLQTRDAVWMYSWHVLLLTFSRFPWNMEQMYLIFSVPFLLAGHVWLLVLSLLPFFIN